MNANKIARMALAPNKPVRCTCDTEMDKGKPWDTCKDCKGTGYVIVCGSCSGAGWDSQASSICGACAGRGVQSAQKPVVV